MSATSFAALQKFVRPRNRVERCEFCAITLPAAHRHVVEPANRRLLCSCRACALLFSGRPQARHRLVPEQVRRLDNFLMTDAQWEDLRLPISLAFFFHNSPANRVVAVYPSPAGPTESLLPLEAWQQLEAENPHLQATEPDVEALLVNRAQQEPDYYLVGIDECYKLVGILRTHWHGLGGGTEVWEKIGAFFDNLRDRAHSAEEGSRCLN